MTYQQLIDYYKRDQLAQEEIRARLGPVEGKELAWNSLMLAKQTSNADALEHAFWLCRIFGFHAEAQPLKQELMYENWHHLHEDMLNYLDSMDGTKNVETFYWWSLNTPPALAWDTDNRAFNRKAVRALVRLQSDDAKKRASILRSSTDPKVCEFVMEQDEQNAGIAARRHNDPSRRT